MTDYTPTTEDEVRRVMTPLIGWPRLDRWLAGVKAEAWHEGFCRGEVSGQRELPLNPYTENPYKEEAWPSQTKTH